MDNYRKYIAKIIKPITEAIYRNMTKQKKKKKGKKGIYLEKHMKKKKTSVGLL